MASVAAMPQYSVSGAWTEPVVITIPGRCGGPLRVAHAVPEITAPLRAVKTSGVMMPRPRSPQS